VQDVLGARRCPKGQEAMIGFREGPTPADGDEPGIALLGQNHGSTVRESGRAGLDAAIQIEESWAEAEDRLV